MRTKKGQEPKYNLVYNFDDIGNQNKPHHYKIVDTACNVVANFRTNKTIEAATVDGSFTFSIKSYAFRGRHAQEIRKAQEAINRKRFLQLTTVVTSTEAITCTGLFD
jgi:hypothetical protein